MLLLPSKCEIIFASLKNGNFSNIAIAILDFCSIAPHLVIALSTLR